MAIPFQCPHCGLETPVSEEFAGMSGECVKCRKPIVVPALRAASYERSRAHGEQNWIADAFHGLLLGQEDEEEESSWPDIGDREHRERMRKRAAERAGEGGQQLPAVRESISVNQMLFHGAVALMVVGALFAASKVLEKCCATIDAAKARQEAAE